MVVRRVDELEEEDGLGLLKVEKRPVMLLLGAP